MKRLLAALVVVFGFIVAPSAAYAATAIADVATALRSDPVFVDPAAPTAISDSEADALRDQIAESGNPIYIAVLPDTGTSADQTLRDIGSGVNQPGIYAVIVGNAFRAGSTSGSVSALATEAFNAQASNGAYAVLSEFVSLVSTQGSASSGSTTTGSSSWSGLIVFLIVIAFIVIAGLFIIRRSRKVKAEQLAKVRSVIEEDVTQFGEQLATVDINDPDMTESTRVQLNHAFDSYDRAKSAAAAMRSANDAGTVTSALENGRYQLSCVNAELNGLPAPEHRPPCFYDPRHGPSTVDEVMSPDGGPMRSVPLCAVCAEQIARGALPEARSIAGAPYWQAGQQYQPYAQGYFGGFGGLMPALFMGTMLGSMMTMPGITSASVDSAGFGGGGGGFGGGDFGGGGFGGGDFGGGDFGGGDF